MIIENLLKGEITQQDIWGAYQDLINYNCQIQLVETVEENRNMYVGRQWEGIETEGLPTATLDFIKPVTQIKIANIMSSKTSISVKPIGLAGKPTTYQEVVAGIVNDQLDKICERVEFNNLIQTLMTNTAVDGDGAWHIFWNDTIETGEVEPGDIDIETVSNAHIYFGNVVDNDAQAQPYIIVERREYLSTLKFYAKELGLSEADISNIQPDTENQFTIINDDNRVTVLRFYWRDYKTRNIKMIECTQNVILQENDTELKLYPVCWQNWEPRLNDYHGESLVSEMVTNQITVNKLASMNAISLSRTAFPTVLYNATLLPDGWDNAVGAAIGIEEMYDIKADDVATTIDPANRSSELDKFGDYILNTTMNLNGTNDSVLGNINPENTSAIIAVQKASIVPLELNRIRLYKFLQDFARIAIDFMTNYYGERSVLIYDPQENEKVIKFNFEELKGVALNIKIEVGASSYWSEIGEDKTLANLLDREIIDKELYVDLMPVGILSGKNKVLKYVRQQKALEQGMMVQDNMGTMLQKSTETASRLKSLQQSNPQAYEQAIKTLNNKVMGQTSSTA